MTGLAKQVLSGDRRAVARLITAVENQTEAVRGEMENIYPRAGKAYRLGVTGPPGSGKSTLVDSLTVKLREHGLTVGIIAIDPTSPFTGGALLGDRIRMQRIGLDPGVFIRSMATRGHLGGLCAAAGDAADILDAFGKDVVITETVGVGQSEVAIVRVADTTLVVLCPESGDAVQTLKAGLMEIADVFVINKCDREGADRLVMDVRSMLELKHFDEGAWRPVVVETSATKGTGIDNLYEAIERHRAYLEQEGRLKAKRLSAAVRKIRDLVVAQVERETWAGGSTNTLEKLGRQVLDGKLTPQAAAEVILRRLTSPKGGGSEVQMASDKEK
jgi:LAO/AO transport system kinase